LRHITEAQKLQPIAVEARFDEQGTVTPLSFSWRGRSYPLTDVGRRWVDEQAVVHFLVMTPPDRIFEIVFRPADLRWLLVQSHERARVV